MRTFTDKPVFNKDVSQNPGKRAPLVFWAEASVPRVTANRVDAVHRCHQQLVLLVHLWIQICNYNVSQKQTSAWLCHH